MSTPPPDDLQSDLDALRRQIAEMTARLAELQRTVSPAGNAQTDAASAASAADTVVVPGAVPNGASTAAAGPAAPGTAADDTIAEETILAISAAVAAFLGERVRVRQIRLISSPAWAQQGRVSIQASHRLDR